MGLFKKRFDKKPKTETVDPYKPIPRIWPVLKIDIVNIAFGAGSCLLVFNTAIICAVSGDLFWTVIAFLGFVLNAWVIRNTWQRISRMMHRFDDALVSMDSTLMAIRRAAEESDPDFKNKMKKAEEIALHGRDDHKQ